MSKVVSQASPLRLDGLNAEMTKRSEEALDRVIKATGRLLFPFLKPALILMYLDYCFFHCCILSVWCLVRCSAYPGGRL